MPTYSQFREQMMSALYQEQVHEDIDGDFSFVNLADEYGLDWREGWLEELQKELRDEGLLRGPTNGFGDEMARGKLSGAGLRYIENTYGTLDGVPTLVSKPAYDELLVPVESEVDSEQAENPVSPAVSTDAWTGGRLVLTDERVLREVRSQANALRERIYETHFQSNSDSHDLKSLADALVSICNMAEPDLTILDRILRHPKFQITAALIAAVATIRGAVGI
jgi:hypothetical protein